MTAAFETIPTTEAVVPEHGTIAFIPLNRLKKSPRNARKTPHAASDIEALAASTREKGILQPPVVEPERRPDGQPTGYYLVTIGEGRRLSQRLRARRKEIKTTEPIRCVIDTAHDAFEISLDENVTRFAMHPADQFEAFRELAQTKGLSAEEIGARFGVAATVVRRRLRLGAVSPKLMAAYRADDLTLDQLMAFAVSEDHARQEQVWSDLSYNRSPSFIRRLMTEHEVEASDRRARFVGAEAYQAAGGRLRCDLFSEEGTGWFEDATLLDRLSLDKLTAEAEAGHGPRPTSPSPMTTAVAGSIRARSNRTRQPRPDWRHWPKNMTPSSPPAATTICPKNRTPVSRRSTPNCRPPVRTTLSRTWWRVAACSPSSVRTGSVSNAASCGPPTRPRLRQTLTPIRARTVTRPKTRRTRCDPNPCPNGWSPT